MTRDLTKGSPMKLILGFGIPVLLGNLFQQLYNVVDTAIVGKTLGGSALAAVGNTGSINFLVVGFCVGVCGGFAIPAAQQFGAGNEKELRRYVAGGVWLTLLLGILLTLSTVLFCKNILTGMQTPDDIFQRSYWYIVTIFAGLPAYFLYNFTASILRSLGDSRTPVIWLSTAAVVNMVLDVIFILAFHLDVFGAALATVLSQLLAGTGCLVRMLRGYPILRMEAEDWHWEGRRMAQLCLMGLPMGLQFSITAIGSVMIQTAVNGLGTACVTAVTAASKVSLFFTCPFDALGSTMATYGGQNVGAGKLDRIGQGLKSCILLGAGYSVIALGISTLFGRPLAKLFLDASEAAIIDDVKLFLTLATAFYFPLALVNIIRFMIQGVGFPFFAILAGVFEMVARALAGFVLVPQLGFMGSCLGSPIAWILADAFLIPAYFHVRKRLRRMAGSSAGR